MPGFSRQLQRHVTCSFQATYAIGTILKKPEGLVEYLSYWIIRILLAMPTTRTVVLGLLGTTLDQGRGPARWNAWRPTIAACQHEDLLVSRLELLHPNVSRSWRNGPHRHRPRLARDGGPALAPRHRRPVGLRGGLRGAARFRPGLPVRRRGRGLPGPHHDRHARRADLPVPPHRVAALPGRLLQTNPPAPGQRGKDAGTFRVIDLDLSRYDRLASRFAREAPPARPA